VIAGGIKNKSNERRENQAFTFFVYIYCTLWYCCSGGGFWYFPPRPLMNVKIRAAHVTMSFVSGREGERGVFLGSHTIPFRHVP
jgi:hypothetical protein